MAKRDEVFHHWGPLLLEAFLELIFTEVNILRTRAGLPPRTKDQVHDQITNHLSTLEPYDWMKETD